MHQNVLMDSKELSLIIYNLLSSIAVIIIWRVEKHSGQNMINEVGPSGDAWLTAFISFFTSCTDGGQGDLINKKSTLPSLCRVVLVYPAMEEVSSPTRAFLQ